MKSKKSKIKKKVTVQLTKKLCHCEERLVIRSLGEGGQRRSNPVLEIASPSQVRGRNDDAEVLRAELLQKKAVVLLSGGMDSAVTLFYAKKNGYKTYCLIFNYGQRHKKELVFAKRLAKLTDSKYLVLDIKLPWKGSALLNTKMLIPKYKEGHSSKIGIPPTYVPARNTIFISFALSFAEAISAKAIFIGANSVDFSGYPDCRPIYFARFNALLKSATKIKGIKIETPLLYKSKKEIVDMGTKLGVPFELTWSCYNGGQNPCGRCDACRLRAKGFSPRPVRSQ